MSNTYVDSSENNIINDNKMNIFQCLKNLIFYPSKLMSYIENKPNTILPILFVLIFSMIIVFSDFNSFKILVRDTILTQFQGSELRVTDGLVNIAIYISLIFSIFTTLFSIFLVTIIFFIFIKLLRGNGDFKQYLSIVAYSSIVNVIGLFILLLSSKIIGNGLFLPNNSIFEILNITPNNNFVATILSYITVSNIFSIWQHIIIAIGVIQISKIRKNYVYIYTTFIYMISIILIH